MKNLSGLLKCMMALGILVIGLLVSERDVKAAECNSSTHTKHTYEISENAGEKTITISGSGTIDKSCGFTTMEVNGIIGTNNISRIVINNGIDTIGNEAFVYGEYVYSVSIPETVTSIGPSAFYYCSRLQDLTIPESVTSIGADAFYGCSQLENIEIPKNVTYIGEKAFYNCWRVGTIIFNSNPVVESHAFYLCTPETIHFYKNDSNLKALISKACDNSTVSMGEELTIIIHAEVDLSDLEIPSDILVIIESDAEGSSTIPNKPSDNKSEESGSVTPADKPSGNKSEESGSVTPADKPSGNKTEESGSLTPADKPSENKSEESGSLTPADKPSGNKSEASGSDTSAVNSSDKKATKSTEAKTVVTKEHIETLLKYIQPETLAQITKSTEALIKTQEIQQEYARVEFDKQKAINDYNLKHQNAQMMYEMYRGTEMEAYYLSQLNAIEKQYEELMELYNKKIEDIQNQITQL